jgi:Arc/MetJ-type ribon-helix-helix transcriptional regulator
MNVHLTAHGEKLLQDRLAEGRYHSPEEVIELALELLAEKEAGQFIFGVKTKAREEAVADILELREGVTLGGISMKALIHEGHKRSG